MEKCEICGCECATCNDCDVGLQEELRKENEVLKQMLADEKKWRKSVYSVQKFNKARNKQEADALRDTARNLRKKIKQLENELKECSVEIGVCVECPACDGNGHYGMVPRDNNVCESCNGKGIVND